jgi:heme exporter protein CcmD
METSDFIVMAYGFTVIALGLLCITTWLRARIVRRTLHRHDIP